MAAIPAHDRQQGAALLLMLLLLVLGGVVLFSRNIGGQLASASQARSNAAMLAAAKEAVLGYVVTHDASHPGKYGFLPCPDIDATGSTAEGEAHETSCGARYRSMLGRFPWRTVGLDPGRGKGRECLWYAVSGTWKSAGANEPELLNTDSSGQFRVLAGDGSTLIAGSTAGERPVAVIIAPGLPIAGQTRATAASGVEQCGGSFVANRYLDNDSASGIDNSNVSAAADAIDDFISADPGGTVVNDQMIFITRSEIEARLMRRADVRAQLTALTSAVAKCIADYGKRNPGGAADPRLPWPAPVDLVEYRTAAQYNDTPVGELSGRVANVVNDSNSQTGNTSTGVLTACNAATVPEWTPTMATLWQHWKDHLFYAVARDFRPDATPVTSCTTCLRVNGTGAWAAIVMFAGTRLGALNQTRDEPPMNADTRSNIGNYLEGRNATNHPNAAGNGDYQSAVAGNTFNDILFCIDATLGVTPC
ncbi:MAG: hypothetical protein R3F27_10855 [Gammaproteobacteria bacterium]